MWRNPLRAYDLIPTSDPMSFQTACGKATGCTGIPLAPHPGAFGVKRKFHTHEGVDLYCDAGATVSAVELGQVEAVLPFTGPIAGFPWWNDTWVVLIEGDSGVVAYGEISPYVQVGQWVLPNEKIGVVTQVLKKDKGRPMSMLHLELHTHGTRRVPGWYEERPSTLLDPTPYLLEIANSSEE